MSARRSWKGPRTLLVLGLLVGALGIVILWASGIDFPIYPPPGILILLAGALFSLIPLRWASGVGALLGLFVLVGFLASPAGLTNLFGRAGARIAIGQGVQVIGVLTAVIAGVITTRANYRTRQGTR